MQDPTKIKITADIIKQSKTFTCDCGGVLFQPGVVFKRISPLISPSGDEELYPLDVLICTKCGKVPTIFNSSNILPTEVLANKNISNERNA